MPQTDSWFPPASPHPSSNLFLRPCFHLSEWHHFLSKVNKPKFVIHASYLCLSPLLSDLLAHPVGLSPKHVSNPSICPLLHCPVQVPNFFHLFSGVEQCCFPAPIQWVILSWIRSTHQTAAKFKHQTDPITHFLLALRIDKSQFCKRPWEKSVGQAKLSSLALLCGRALPWMSWRLRRGRKLQEVICWLQVCPQWG